MGSGEDLAQMVRDYIELSESNTKPITSQSYQYPTYLYLQEAIGKHTDDEAEIHRKILTYVRTLETVSNQVKKDLKEYVVMRLKMEGYEASICRTSWVSSLGLHKVIEFREDYEYIDVMLMERNQKGRRMQTRLIVDTDFRSQFELARPTATYTELVNSLPVVFVGREEKLNTIICLVSEAAKRSLEDNGLDIPPWRKLSYMKQKWFANECNKISASPSCSININYNEEEDGAKTAFCPSIFSGPVI